MSSWQSYGGFFIEGSVAATADDRSNVSHGPVLAVARTGDMLYAGHMKLGCWSQNGVDVYDISQGVETDPVKVGEVATAGTPVALRVVGEKLMVAQLKKRRDVMRCFAGVSCYPPRTVEVFDITNRQAPLLLTELPFDVVRARAEITSAFGRRFIPPGGVARRLNTTMYSPSSRLAGRAPRRPRCDELVSARAPRDILESFRADGC